MQLAEDVRPRYNVAAHGLVRHQGKLKFGLGAFLFASPAIRTIGYS